MARKPVRSCRALRFTDPDIGALQALERGDATKEQQQRALKWIVEEAGRRDGDTFLLDEEGGERASSFMAGRRFVALEVLKLVHLSGAARVALIKSEQSKRS